MTSITPVPALPAQRPADRTPALSLALQGGGAHGAFTWGVLDRLLDEEDLTVDRITGASAGALNGAAFASGFARGGRAGAREALALLWAKVAEAGTLMTLFHLPIRKPGMGVWDDAMPLTSPYQTNPMALEPLRYILQNVVDIDALRSPAAPQLHVNAVNVHTGSSRVFGPADLSIDALMASACAPLMFQAVQIDGVPYWDGSYAGNAMLWPLCEPARDVDVLLVELTPLHRTETPTTAKNILNRINEIASINALVAELRALAAAGRLADTDGRTAGAHPVRLHCISLPETAAAEPSTKRTVGSVLFQSLREHGRRACDAWLAAHRSAIGARATVDAVARYLTPHAQPVGGAPSTPDATAFATAA